VKLRGQVRRRAREFLGVALVLRLDGFQFAGSLARFSIIQCGCVHEIVFVNRAIFNVN
jgi:hypothetical protein